MDGNELWNMGMKRERERGVGEDGGKILEMGNWGGKGNTRIFIKRKIAERKIKRESGKRSVMI